MDGASLLAAAALSKENFESAVDVLYDSMEYSDYELMIETNPSVATSRKYTSLVRHLTAPWGLSDLSGYFANFPNLRVVHDDDDTTMTLVSSTSHRTAFILDFTSDITADKAPTAHPESDLMEDCPLAWDVTWRVSEATITHRPDLTTAEKEKDLKILINAWRCRKGLFKFAIKRLHLDLPIPCQKIIELLGQTSTKHSSTVPKSPKSLHICPVTEEGGGPDIVDLIGFLSYQVEELEIDLPEGDISSCKNTMTVRRFFTRVPHTLDQMRSFDGMKLKRLAIMLHQPADEDLADLDISYEGPPIALDTFSVTLDLADVDGSDDVVDMTQLAKGMLSIGGINCRYTLDIVETDENPNKSDEWNNALQEATGMLIQAERQKIPVGWKRLLPDERVCI
ncbi:uncharacterized protein I303_106373 [Kwoniella dejecticola CBS 10117]|uniref:Uncharacterized protein n=1 Tax=Kwoniella dejecticola CBS 10117 TaxID=1296121 RepID=A0A1A5ZUW9_9TREE|nr:uncharacterized protein I303_08370 [Kwoniella dejecticola CBS 10117]OBR81599.1 hypothetical protein I303_08370 [Kwoniella dejecticola CBS 10117]